MTINKCRSHARGDSVRVSEAHLTYILQVLDQVERGQVGSVQPVFDPQEN